MIFFLHFLTTLGVLSNIVVVLHSVAHRVYTHERPILRDGDEDDTHAPRE